MSCILSEKGIDFIEKEKKEFQIGYAPPARQYSIE